jgi:tryptophanyl-tRNA synthetase
MKTVFSGIQPSGLVHLGNLLGAINNWVKLSNENSKNYFCIVDLHSLTGLPNKNDLKKSINDTLKVLVASGINTKTSVIYTQSNLQEHAYLSWILSNFCQVGELQRMTQFKEKASSFGTHSGLLTYPILMASDILIHKANEVPVGDDQTQHLELTRNIVRYDPKNKPGISNLIEIYAAVNDKEISDTEKEFENSQYGEFKIAVAETVIDYLDPIKKNFDDLTSDNLEDIVVSNLKSAKDSAQKTIIEVEEALGIS